MLLHRRLDPSRATTSSLVVPCPVGLAYDPYQVAAVEYAVTRPDTLIGDDPGLGKTIEAIGIANYLRSQRILVVCPGFLKPNWEAEMNKWLFEPHDVMCVESGEDVVFAEVTIINYELLEKHGWHLRAIDWNLLIVDEVHRLKNKRADRTRQIFGGIKRDSNKRIVDRVTPIRADVRIFLTGTPVLNGKPKELWPLVEAIDPEGLGSDWFAYAKTYCDLIEITRLNPGTGKEERTGWIWNGETNADDLQKRIREKFMIRRLKSDVMTQLPAKRRMILPLEANRTARALIKKEWQAYEEYAAGRQMIDCEMPEFGDFAKRMLEIGLLMVKPTIEVIQSELESVNKLVVMCYHNEVARQIAAAFPNSILINGDVDAADRFGLSEQFQQNPSIHLQVCTIGSAGEGLTMTAAYVMLFPERDWTPGKMTQAEDRIHRRGQNEQVIYKHLVLAGSLSEHQVRILIDKQNANDRILDRKGV